MPQPNGTIPIPDDEDLRLAAVERYKLGGIGREPAFDHITRLAAELFDVPMSVVSIIGSDMQCFRGACGLDSDGTPRDVAFCAFAILDPEVTVVPDAIDDPRFANNPLVLGDPFIRFYAGAPLRVGGQPVGTLCLIDTKPRQFGADERKRLADLARTVVDLIELRVQRFATEDHRRKLDEERELLKLTVENVSEGVALFDGDLRLMLWNEDFVDLLGYPRGAVKEGIEAAILVERIAASGALGSGDPAQITAGLMASIRTTESRRLDLTGPNGRTLEFWRKTLADGRFIATVRDVTDERQMARMKDELVSTVSHELRTPLAAIVGAVGLLDAGAAGPLDAKAARLVTLGKKNAERLTELVNDLLDMDKLQSGRMPFRFEAQDLGALLAEAAEQNQPYADRYHVTFALDLPGAPLIVPVDRTRLFQVITNLLSNACKFSPAGSTVHLSLRREDPHACIRVRDAGPGIGPAFRHRLFTRFAQEEGEHQAGHAGTGLGLAISKAIVDAHDGSIALDETFADGAAFDICLPLVRGAV
ncbi:MAG: PAS-domain containing protein [Sphingomonadales bacterium]|nr:PAS-domain containing protein [Sphingomonadales bacterium]